MVRTPELDALNAMHSRSVFAERLNQLAERRAEKHHSADAETKEQRRLERNMRKALKARRKQGRR